MKKNKSTKIVAFIALIAILLWVLWTGINFLLQMADNQEENVNESTLTPEQLEQLKQELNSQNNTWNNQVPEENTNVEDNTENQ